MQNYTKIFSFAICVFINVNCFADESQFVTTITPERQKEFLIERDLGKAAMSWLADNNELAALECDKFVDSLLAVREPTVRTYFLEAQVAYLRQNPKKAISALKKAIEKYPDEIAPNMSYPVRIVGRFWIATIARQSDDFAQAQKIYESILKELNSLEDKEILLMICNLYLAEMDLDHQKNKKDAISKLNSSNSIPRPSGQRANRYDFYRTWTQYNINEISFGKEQAAQQNIQNNTEVFNNYMWIVYQLELVGIVASPIAGCCGSDRRAEEIGKTFYERILQSSKSSIDDDIVRFICGFVYQQKKNYSEAEKHYSQLFNKDAFLSPVAGIYLAQCKKNQNDVGEAENVLKRVESKYPGYSSVVTQIRKSLRN